MRHHFGVVHMVLFSSVMSNKIFYSLLGFFDLAFTCCSSWLMVCIAFERFCAVWLPHHSKTIFTHRKLFFLVLGIFLMSTMLSTWFIFVVKMVTKTRIASLIKTPFK
jgi:hypothetical protein